MTVRDVSEIECPECGHVVEFWPDELVRRCRECGHRFSNPDNSMKCLEWCQYAAQCMASIGGEEDPWSGPLCNELIDRMKTAFGDDQRRIDHALAVLEMAQRIGRDTGADPLVVVPAAILHDVGRAGSQGGVGQAEHGREGRALAGELLADLGFPAAVKDDILDLIEYHHDRGKMDSRNGAVVFDADLIVNLQGWNGSSRTEALERDALTQVGRRVGTERFAARSGT